MKDFIKVFTCYYFFLLNRAAIAAEDNYVRKGQYPFMAFIYCPDDTVRDESRSRFFQNSILIKPDWLISSSVDVGEHTFPVKTLIARLGAFTIDANFTFNEDEDEQEREVIKVVRPTNFVNTEIWKNDISLLNTLLPFNITSAVKTIPLNLDMKFNGKNCKILAFMRTPPKNENMVLISVGMELQETSECGPKYRPETMICGIEEDAYKNTTSKPEFCRDNAGGPLICDDEVAGLQTYLEEDSCKPPRLFQLIKGWSKFIECGTIHGCQVEFCSGICKATPKDPPKEDILTSTINVMKLLSEATTKATESPVSSSYADTSYPSSIKVVVSSETPIADVTLISRTSPEEHSEKSSTTSTISTTTSSAIISSSSSMSSEVTHNAEETNMTEHSGLESSKINYPDEIARRVGHDAEITTTNVNNSTKANETGNPLDGVPVEEVLRDVKVEAKQKVNTARSATSKCYLVSRLFLCPLLLIKILL